MNFSRINFLFVLVTTLCLIARGTARAGWVVLPPSDDRRSLPSTVPADAKAIEPGAAWPDDNHYRWLIGDLVIPEQIDGKQTRGAAVGMQIDCGDGGEVWLDGKIQCRFDNDHPALAILSESAQPGAAVRVAVQVFPKVQGGDHFASAKWVLLDAASLQKPLRITALMKSAAAGPDARRVPAGIVGLSQGGGMCDYEPATARKLRDGGFKWFRMDNELTNAVKRNAADGAITYDFSEIDRRLDFMREIGAEPIFAASYMPQVFDAVPDPERHSAPADYDKWQALCAAVARHALERGTPVRYWEVWNETNAGWLKPGPLDTGSEPFAALCRKATGKDVNDKSLVRRVEAYCKLYRATALGVRQGDPNARVGGPALASGPMDALPGVQGETFARALMLWCDSEKLPLDFLSWHEYFQTADVISSEAEKFRKLAQEVGGVADQRPSLPLFVTEWNEAWWPDHPHDNEIGAAWCADGLVRAFIAHRIERPCLFYAKQSDDGMRGDWGILMKNNVPKATFNVAKVFNSLRGNWVTLSGDQSDDVCAVAAWDASTTTLRVVLVDFRPKYAMRKQVSFHVDDLPPALGSARWNEWTIDAAHSNAWNDRAHADLEQTNLGRQENGDWTGTLGPNSVTLLELHPQSAAAAAASTDTSGAERR